MRFWRLGHEWVMAGSVGIFNVIFKDFTDTARNQIGDSQKCESLNSENVKVEHDSV
jgi:hypothetical protein